MRISGVIGVCVLLYMTPSFAQSESQKATADALFDAARHLMEEKKFKEACQKFKDSHGMDPAVGTLLNLALCYKAAGMTASAWSTYREAAAYAKAQGSSEREGLAREEADKLESQLSRLVIEVSDEAAGTSELQILRDGQVQPQSVWGVALPVDPGTVVLEWSAPGYESARQEILIQGEGKRVPVTIPALKRLEGAAAVEEQERNEASEPSEDGGRGSAGPWVLGGIGLAFGAAGGTFAVLTLLSNNQARDVCPDQDGSGSATAACSSDDIATHESYTNRAHTYRTVSYVGLGVGGAALIGAGIWALAGGGGDNESVSVAPLVSPGEFGISARGRF